MIAIAWGLLAARAAEPVPPSEAPDAPAAPGAPQVPAAPAGAPDTPEVPAAPAGAPGTPEVPAASAGGAPDTPEVPAAPAGAPDTPEVPAAAPDDPAPPPEPDWSARNARTVAELAARGDDPTATRTVDHLARLPDAPAAAAAAERLAALGFRVEPPAAGDDGRLTLAFHRDDPLADGAPDRFVAEVRAALGEGAAYEGWGAPVVPKPPPPPPAPRERVVDRIAATVNDDLLALSEVWELGRDFIGTECPTRTAACVRDAELEILDSLIRRSLVEQELERLDLEVTAQDVDQAIDRTVAQYGMADRQALRAEVERSGKRWDDYRNEILEFLRTQSFQQRVLASRVSVTEDELQDAYQRVARKVKTKVATVSAIGQAVDPASPPADIEAQVREMFELAGFLRDGQIPWEEAVTEYDRGLAPLLGGKEWTEGSIVDVLREPMFHREVGLIQDPVQFTLPTGVEVIAILRVDALTERSEALPLAEVRDQLEEQVFSEKLQAAEEEWYQRARREAAVVIHL